MSAKCGIAQMLTGLLQAAHLSALEEVPSLVAEHAARAGLDRTLIYLVDLQQDVLRPLTGRIKNEEAVELRIDGTLAGRAFQETRIIFRPGEDGDIGRWWVPLLDGTERLGVLRVSVREPVENTVENTVEDVVEDVAENTVEDVAENTAKGSAEDAAENDTVENSAENSMRALAALVALLVVSKRSHSDSHARLVRTRQMNVAAEMQWNLMPPLTFANHEVVIGAVLEPAYELGGDAFDYAIDGGTIHLSIFDAMGHDTSAGLTANLAVAACRNQRRQGTGLVETSESIEQILIEQFGRATRFATAVLARLDIPTGMLSWVNRGHHPPVVIRGGRWITLLQCPPSHPLGLDLGIPVTLCRSQLEPGDRLLLYTDGITEARNAGGHEFGLERFTDFIIRHNADGLPVPETLRRLIHSVLDYHGGHLQDDATVLLVEWHGRSHRQMDL